MRKAAIAVMLLLLPVLAHADYTWKLSSKLSLGFNTSYDLDVVGHRDLKHDQWMTGYGKELIYLMRGDKKSLYLAANHLFNVNDREKGTLILSLGVNIGTLAERVHEGVALFIPDSELPNWFQKGASWVALEGGGGYRLGGVPEGQTPWVYTVGGKVKIPLEHLTALLGRKKKADAE